MCNLNMIIKADSLTIQPHQPETEISIADADAGKEANIAFVETDSVAFCKGERIVVADILPISDDSLWVQVASQSGLTGWLPQADLMRQAVPDDPISIFIYSFSESHNMIALAMLVIIGLAYTVRLFRRERIKVVHFNDIPAFYPTLLTLIVAASATFYASIQMFASHEWQLFYIDPTLNPFAVGPLLMVFLSSVWAIIIVGIASVDVTFQTLKTDEAIIYLLGLFTVCAIDYIVFSLCTLYYIGYPMLVAYTLYALWIYKRKSTYNYICGSCGQRMLGKGRCPRCGAENV